MAPGVNPPLSVRTLGKAMRKMKLSDNCVMMIKSGTDLARMDNLKELENAIALAGIANVVFVIVDDFTDLKVLDKETMSNAGWYYIDSIRKKLFGRKDDTQSVQAN